MSKWMKYIGARRAFSRIVLGLTFVFSGFVKTVDPWGTALKITEYLNVWGIGSIGEARIWIAILFCAAELMLGLMLVFGVKTRATSVTALAVMSVFLVVTLLSATVLPVGDCGCFGDAVHLSPWASFGKNVVLCVLAFIVWLDARRQGLTLRPITVREWVLTALFACVSVGLGVYCYRHLPLIDFLPYRTGVNLYEAKYIDEESDIRLREFTVFNSGGDGTYELLSTGGRVYILSAIKLDLIKPRCAERFEKVVDRASGEGARVVLITSSPISDDETAAFGSAAPVTVYNVDATTMITMLRAQVGMVTLDGGVIVDKRNCRDIKF